MSGDIRAEKAHALQSGDVWGGLAASLVALPSSIAFGVLVFSAIDPGQAGQGALFGIAGAAALGLVAPLIGRTPALVSAPCAPAAAVLAGLATSLIATGINPGRIPGLLVLTALGAALLQMLYGIVRGGRFIKYIPYPVVSGYLSGVGLIIAIGQLPKLLGLPPATQLLEGLASPSLWQWPGIVVGLATIALMLAAPRLTQKVPAAIIGLAGGVATYFLIALLMPELRSVEQNALIIGPLSASGSLLESIPAQFRGLMAVQLDDLELIAWSALALSALLSIDTLKTCVVLDAMTHGRHNSNRELFGQGVANLAAFATGGMPGAGTMGPTLVNVSSGGASPWSGFMEGVFVVLVLLVLSPLIAWVPIGALAGILLVVAFRMFDWHAFKLLRFRDTRFDFAVMAAVVVVAETVGLIQASAVGIGLAIVLFIRDQIRSSVLRRRTTLKETSSKTRRLQSARDILTEHGDEAGALDLQGNLFFGTTDQLFTEIEPSLRTQKWLLLDLRRVQSMDYTAANLFRQMHARLGERGGGLLFCGMPSGTHLQNIEQYLTEVGLLGPQGAGIRVFDMRDDALEWMEDKILVEWKWHGLDDGRVLDLSQIDLLREMDAPAIEELRRCFRTLSLKAGASIFRQGDRGDEIFLVRRGEVRVLMPLSGGKRHHLSTFGRGDFFGELVFLDKGTRSADGEALTDCELYALSRREFDEFSHAHPDLGVRVFARLARAVSLRLRQTDVELRAMEER